MTIVRLYFLSHRLWPSSFHVSLLQLWKSACLNVSSLIFLKYSHKFEDIPPAWLPVHHMFWQDCSTIFIVPSDELWPQESIEKQNTFLVYWFWCINNKENSLDPFRLILPLLFPHKSFEINGAKRWFHLGQYFTIICSTKI